MVDEAHKSKAKEILDRILFYGKNMGLRGAGAAVQELATEGVSDLVAWLAETFPPEVLEEALKRARGKNRP